MLLTKSSAIHVKTLNWSDFRVFSARAPLRQQDSLTAYLRAIHLTNLIR